MKKIILHPLLLSLFPIVAMYENNKDFLVIDNLALPIALMAFFTMGFFLLMNVLFRDKHKTAIFVSAFALTFFLVGFALDVSGGIWTFNNMVIIFYSFIVIFAMFVLTYALKNKYVFNYFLNYLGVFLISFSIFNITVYEVNRARITKLIIQKPNEAQAMGEMEFETQLPDIYYFVLDAYARNDILKEYYNYDNSRLTDYLGSRGFYVADKSNSNYSETAFSLASSLNLDYLSEEIINISVNKSNRNSLLEYIKKNKVSEYLKNKGYMFVTLPNTYSGDNGIKSDYAIGGKRNENRFSFMVLEKTPLKVFFYSGENMFYEDYRNKMIFNFEHTPDISKFNNSTFAYVHVLTPHAPFLFGDNNGRAEVVKIKSPMGGTEDFNGLVVSHRRENIDVYRRLYVNQLENITTRTIDMIEKILINSDKKPIIILQSDHGPQSLAFSESAEKTNMEERMGILNAYLLPERAEKYYKEDLSPVNSFRILFNVLFDENYELLENKSFYIEHYNTVGNKPKNIYNVTEKVTN